MNTSEISKVFSAHLVFPTGYEPAGASYLPALPLCSLSVYSMHSVTSTGFDVMLEDDQKAIKA